jgi:transcriptional regulator GlxA family with amidase domain
LDGVEATTHHRAIEHFRRNAPNTRIVADRRYVDNGKIITAAGVTAGIDAALHIVERLLGPEVADNTARYIEYARRREPSSASR